MPLNLECQQGKAKKKQNGRKAMKDAKNARSGVGVKTGQPPGRWMAPGIGVGAAMGILLGNLIPGPLVGSQDHRLYSWHVYGGTALGLVSGLLLSPGQGHKTINKKEKEN